MLLKLLEDRHTWIGVLASRLQDGSFSCNLNLLAHSSNATNCVQTISSLSYINISVVIAQGILSAVVH